MPAPAVEAAKPKASWFLSALVGLAMFLMLAALLIFSRELGFSKFIYVDF